GEDGEQKKRAKRGGLMWNLPRRNFLHLAAGAAALPAVSRIARAQTYPTRPVRMIVGFPAGGGADTLARLTAQWLSERLGPPFLVVDPARGGTNIPNVGGVHAPAAVPPLLLGGPSDGPHYTRLYSLHFQPIRHH